MGRGRKTKLTPELQRKLTSFIAAGNYVDVACAASGISTATFYRWLEQGEKAKSGIYQEFRETCKKAEAVAEMKRIKTITDAADLGDWRAALAYLERRYPDRWSRRERVDARVEHNGKVTERHEYDITRRIEQYEDVYSRIAGCGAPEGDHESDDPGESIHSP